MDTFKSRNRENKKLSLDKISGRKPFTTIIISQVSTPLGQIDAGATMNEYSIGGS